MTGFSGFIGAMRGGEEDRPDPLTRAMLAPEPRDPEPRDPDEIAANLLGRGYGAGQVSDLARRLADKRAELAGEREKIERGERVTARVRGHLERGQVGGLEAFRMMDGDFGDASRAEQLERQCANLERQIGEASELIAPAAQRDADPYEAASRHAHDVFVEVTRARMAELEAGRPAPRPERRPFAGRGSVAVRSEYCVHCTANNVSDEQSYLLHSDPEFNVPVTTAEQLEREQAEQAARHDPYQPGAVITTGYRDIAR
jgi:hypothetical protein